MKSFFKFIIGFLFLQSNFVFSQDLNYIKNYPETEKNNTINKRSPNVSLLISDINPCEENQVPLSELLSDDRISKERQNNHFCAGEFLREGYGYYKGDKIKIDKNLAWAYDHYIRSILTPCRNNVNPCLSSDVIFTDKKLADNVIECNEEMYASNNNSSRIMGSVCALALEKLSLIEIERASNAMVMNKKSELEIRRKLIKSNRLNNNRALLVLSDIYREGFFVDYNHLYAYSLIEGLLPSEVIKKIQNEDKQKIELLEKKTFEQCISAPQNNSQNPKLRCSATTNKLTCDAYSKIDICAISLNNGRCSFAKTFRTFDIYNSIIRKKTFDIGDRISFDIQGCNLLKVDFIFDSKNTISFEF